MNTITTDSFTVLTTLFTIQNVKVSGIAPMNIIYLDVNKKNVKAMYKVAESVKYFGKHLNVMPLESDSFIFKLWVEDNTAETLNTLMTFHNIDHTVETLIQSI